MIDLPAVLMYHYVRDLSAGPMPGYQGTDIATFEAQLDDLCRNRTPVTWRQVRRALDAGTSLPPDGVLLTFDDGLMDHHRYVLPRLAARGVAGLFFVMARRPDQGLVLGHRLHVLISALGGPSVRSLVVERLPPAIRSRFLRFEAANLGRRPDDAEDAWKRPLQRELEPVAAPILAGLVAERVGPEDEIAAELYLGDREHRDLADAGMDLGGHGLEHPWLDAVGRARLRDELGASAAWLGALCPPPWPFAYPYGGVPRSPARALADAGFCAGFTTDPCDRRDRYRIGRLDGDALEARPSGALSVRDPAPKPANAVPRP